MSLTLQIDNREPTKIFNLFRKAGVEFEIKQLLVGDIRYKNYIFERKSITDFMSSIFDGRIWYQVENMKQFDRAFLIISGKSSTPYFAKQYFNLNVFLGTIASIISRGVEVMWVENDSQLVKLVIKICEKMDKVREIVVRKQQRVSREDVYLNMLTCIPGVGRKKAELILKNVTFKKLFDTSVEELTKIKGVGEKLASSIKKYI